MEQVGFRNRKVNTVRSGSIKTFQYILMVFFQILSLSACSADSTDSFFNKTPQKTLSNNGSHEVNTPVVIKFFSNVPDRTQGLGNLEQKLLDEYLKDHPELNIKTEFLHDEIYRQKILVYMTSNDLPDIFFTWSLPSFFDPLVKGSYLAELNLEDYTQYDFQDGALDSFTRDGKLYGLPKNLDFWVLYYHADIFEKMKIKVPENYLQLLETVRLLRAKGITPCAINGQDKWSLAINLQVFIEESANETNHPDEIYYRAACYYKKLMDAGFYQPDFDTTDYSSARNLFLQGRTAMYTMGSWEMGMATDVSIPEKVRNNIRAAVFLGPGSGVEAANNLVGWYGGGYSVYSNSSVKTEAIKLINTIMRPGNYAKLGWNNGYVIPPVNLVNYLNGKESALQKDLIDILERAGSISGPAFNDRLTPGFKSEAENLVLQLSKGVLIPEMFVEELKKAKEKAESDE